MNNPNLPTPLIIDKVKLGKGRTLSYRPVLIYPQPALPSQNVSHVPYSDVEVGNPLVASFRDDLDPDDLEKADSGGGGQFSHSTPIFPKRDVPSRDSPPAQGDESLNDEVGSQLRVCLGDCELVSWSKLNSVPCRMFPTNMTYEQRLKLFVSKI